MDIELRKIVESYLKDFDDKKDLSFVMQPAIPIVWFGNMEKYLQSNTKILTVSLNPSDKEFPRYPEQPRFRMQGKINADTLYKALNEYFEYNPYWQWFNNYEHILKNTELNASYCGAENTAIHIDIFSAIATNPTWGKLSDKQKYEMTRTDLFSKLFSYLNPDVILFSVNQTVFDNIFGDWSFCGKKYMYDDKGQRAISPYKNDNRLLIYGRNFRGTPFGGMSQSFVTAAINDILAKY